jgi:hypothetical protein
LYAAEVKSPFYLVPLKADGMFTPNQVSDSLVGLDSAALSPLRCANHSLCEQDRAWLLLFTKDRHVCLLIESIVYLATTRLPTALTCQTLTHFSFVSTTQPSSPDDWSLKSQIANSSLLHQTNQTLSKFWTYVPNMWKSES